MSRAALRSARGMVALSVGCAAVIAALVVAGLLPTTTRTYALGDPNFGPAVNVTHGHAACEGPITSDGPASGVEFFGVVGHTDPRVAVDVDSLNGRVIASGRIHHPQASSQQDVGLNRSVPGGTPVRVCIRVVSGAYDLKGSGVINPQVHATGVADGAQFSLLLTRPRTPFSSLSTAFGRASIFRPSWIGPWFFWLLLALLVAAFVTVGIGIRSATAADQRERAAAERVHAPSESP